MAEPDPPPIPPKFTGITHTDIWRDEYAEYFSDFLKLPKAERDRLLYGEWKCNGE